MASKTGKAWLSCLLFLESRVGLRQDKTHPGIGEPLKRTPPPKATQTRGNQEKANLLHSRVFQLLSRGFFCLEEKESETEHLPHPSTIPTSIPKVPQN
eukprot:680008-Amphidinium_carterae.1